MPSTSKEVPDVTPAPLRFQGNVRCGGSWRNVRLRFQGNVRYGGSWRNVRHPRFQGNVRYGGSWVLAEGRVLPPVPG